jgi:hypothetical protein
MPSTSKKQHNFMAAIAKNPAFAKKVGIKQSVGEDFIKADKGKKFGTGGMTRPDAQDINKPKTQHGKMALFNKGGDMMNSKMKMFEKSGKDTEPKGMREGSKKERVMDRMQMMGMKKGGMAEGGKMDTAQDKAMIKKAFKQHDMQEHKGGKGTSLKLKNGGMAASKMGAVKTGKTPDGIAVKGKTKGTMISMKRGGKTC